MKSYIAYWHSNYGLAFAIINTDNISNAKKIASENGAWDDCIVEEIDNEKIGIVLKECS